MYDRRGGARTDVDGVYRCGAAAHPGGEASAARGWNAAPRHSRRPLESLAVVSEQGVHDGLREPPVLGVDRDGDAVVVRLAGELDLYNAHQVRETLLDESSKAPERLVVELSRVTFVDSTALGVLIEARAKLANNRAFLLASPQPEARRALEVSGLDRHFSVYDTVAAALAAKL
jgi:anti-sigma B factor antagonist